MLPEINGEMRVVNDAELRFTPTGQAVANFRAVSNSRKKNEAGEWVDDKPCWLNITAWGRLAENVAETCTKGRLITVKGRLATREYEDREGAKRISVDVTADYIGLAITFAPAQPVGGGGQTERVSGGAAADDDPFASPAPAAAAPVAQPDEPPF